MIEKKKIPLFKRNDSGSHKRVDASWRKPHGIDSKQRVFKSGFGASPAIGYRQPRAVRGMHPSGKVRVVVHNVRELEKVVKGAFATIAGTVGGKKRKAIIAAAKEKKIFVD